MRSFFGAMSKTTSNLSCYSVKLGDLWTICIRDGKLCCAECGLFLKDLNIRACETGTFYCSDECPTKNVKENNIEY